MPNWKIHLEVGKRLNNNLHYDKEQYNLYLLGNLLPDVNNCYLVKDIAKRLSHEKTHLQETDFNIHIHFYNKYKNNITINPVFLGYFTHLYTDYIWNKDFYGRVEKRKEFADYSREELRILKQDDFKSYNDLFIKNRIDLEINNALIKEMNQIDEISITKSDIEHVMYFLDTQEKSNLDLKFYQREELDHLLENTIDTIDPFIKKLK